MAVKYTSPSLDYLDLVHPSHQDLDHLKHPSHPPRSAWDALQNIFPYGSLRCIKALRDVKMYNQCTFVYLYLCICICVFVFVCLYLCKNKLFPFPGEHTCWNQKLELGRGSEI